MQIFTDGLTRPIKETNGHLVDPAHFPKTWKYAVLVWHLVKQEPLSKQLTVSVFHMHPSSEPVCFK